jgi:hypothetical protein
MFRKPFEVAGAKFELVEKTSTPWTSRTIWRNVNYNSQGEEIVITGSSRRFEELIDRLIIDEQQVLRFISEICLVYWINPTTGNSGSSEGYLKGDKNVLRKLIKKSGLRWIDKALGISVSTLEVDEEYLKTFSSKFER